MLLAALAGAEGRIVQADYVTDYQKYQQLDGVALTIFPSLFEGLGLPVLESLSVGTSCVASFGSSMPEVGGGRFVGITILVRRRIFRGGGVEGNVAMGSLQGASELWASRLTWLQTVAAMQQALA